MNYKFGKDCLSQKNILPISYVLDFLIYLSICKNNNLVCSSPIDVIFFALITLGRLISSPKIS